MARGLADTGAGDDLRVGSSRPGESLRPHWRYRWERATMRLLTRVVIGRRLHVEGLERVPSSGPLILVGNHIATCDPPMVGARIARDDLFYMCKEEAMRSRVGRFFLLGWNAFPVRRHTADRRALALSLRCLAEGHVLVMFPEGTRSAQTSLRRAFPGVGFLALRSGSPVLCVAVWGTEDVLPKGTVVPHRADVSVHFGEPFTIERRHPDGRAVTNQEAADLIMRRLAELLPSRYRGVYLEGSQGVDEHGDLGSGETDPDTDLPADPASAA